MCRTAVLRLILIIFMAATPFCRATAMDNDSIIMLLRGLVNHALAFAERMPREKVSVHLDNTGYYRGDRIWFQCYVVDGAGNTPTQLSHTLYVELLNPRGKIIAKQILKIVDGRCHGSFNLTHLPFYSGFYEIRAYTKYMLNFGDAAVFSRVIPVFEAPKKAGDFADRRMARAISRYPGSRPGTKAPANVSMRFFPEGGSLIAGLPARVAFELTGRGGKPVDGAGVVIDESTGDTLAYVRSVHEGRGVFEITPESGGKYKVVIACGDKNDEHKFKLPQVRETGVGLSVDNVSDPDSVLITVRTRKDPELPPIAGMSVSSWGGVWSYSFFNLSKERSFRFGSRAMPPGVAVITVFGHDGRTLAERMIYVNNGGYGRVETALDRIAEEPHGRISLQLSATDADGLPAAGVPLSVSATVGSDAVDYQGGALADLLLMSEIKGYVRNPMQYFRDTAATSRRNLDMLMMVSGWRCYSWEEMAGIKSVGRQYDPEEAIDLGGKVVSFVRGIPKANAELSVMVTEKDVPDSVRRHFMDRLTTDSCGRFNLSYDLTGKWDLLMTVSEKGRKKDHRIILDRLFSPAPRKYEPAEMSPEYVAADIVDEAALSLGDAVSDTAATDGDTAHIPDPSPGKAIILDEVVVKGKRNREAEIFKARSKSIVYYDMQEELGDLTDRGNVVGKDLFEVLKNINPGFNTQYDKGEEKIRYKTKKPLFVINYKKTYDRDSLNYTLLYPESIKSVFITEDAATILKYADPHYTMFDIDVIFGCAVLIETFPGQKGPADRGTRLQMIEGYTVPEEFQNIESKDLIDEPDLRRTLYWNPLLTTGPDGKARIEFFNSPASRKIRLSIQGIDSKGTIYSN